MGKQTKHMRGEKKTGTGLHKLKSNAQRVLGVWFCRDWKSLFWFWLLFVIQICVCANDCLFVATEYRYKSKWKVQNRWLTANAHKKWGAEIAPILIYLIIGIVKVQRIQLVYFDSFAMALPKRSCVLLSAECLVCSGYRFKWEETCLLHMKTLSITMRMYENRKTFELSTVFACGKRVSLHSTLT